MTPKASELLASTKEQREDKKNPKKKYREPDRFFLFLQQIFSNVSKHKKPILIVCVGVVLIGVGITFWFQYQSKREIIGKNELFLAENEIETTRGELNKDKNKSDQVVDVEAVFSGPIKKLKDVVSTYKNSRPGFEASVALANLYFDNNKFQDSIEWYEKAVKMAPGKLEAAFSFSLLSRALENAGNYDKAIESLQKAAGFEFEFQKGDILLSIARNYDQVGKKDEAVKIYDRVLTELPDTEYAKLAKIYKEQK